MALVLAIVRQAFHKLDRVLPSLVLNVEPIFTPRLLVAKLVTLFRPCVDLQEALIGRELVHVTALCLLLRLGAQLPLLVIPSATDGWQQFTTVKRIKS